MFARRERLRLSVSTARVVLERARVDVGSGVRVTRVKSGNDVFRFVTGTDTFFLKVPTKDLEAWPEPLEGAASKVIRETAAHQCLRDHHLPAPEVVGTETGRENPVGRPYLITRRVPGRPLTRVVPLRARHGWRGPLEAVGGFLAAVHAIQFQTPGYLTPDGPVVAAPPEVPSPTHDPRVAQAEARRDLATAAPFLTSDLLAELDQRISKMARLIAAEYESPRFVINGFHPNHPFLENFNRHWRVTGCIDLEGASAGSPFADLATFAWGLMLRSHGEAPWWEPFFAGYGIEPSFERFRIALLSDCAYYFGEVVGMEQLGGVYSALLAADSWRSLFNAHRTPVVE